MGPELPETQRRQCPRCGDTNISAPTGDGNILALCGHVWPDPDRRRGNPVPVGAPAGPDEGIFERATLLLLARHRR